MRRASKLLSLLLVLTLALSISAPVGAAYSDTSGHWAESAIDRWSAYGIVSGDGHGFNPDGNLTRGQMAKVLAETLGLTKQGDNPFADVPAGAWYTPYVLRCYEAGIMMGDGVNANPNATITREEAMVMLCRALGIAPASEGALASFNDGGSVASWAAPYVAAMVQSGIVSGVGNNTLAPTGNISRAALMTILDRSIVQYINEPGSYELTDKAGIVLVAAGDVTLTGSTSADVLVSPAAEGKAVAFDGATVTGSVTVQAEDAKVTSENSTLPSVSFTGEGGGKVETVTPTEPTKPTTTPTTGGGSSSGGGGSNTPSHTHSWGEGVVTTAATCTTAGAKTFTCSCGQTKTEAIPALGHTPAVEYATPDETGHWHVCTVCGEPADKTAHNYGNITDCNNVATCAVCGYEKAAGTHVWGEAEVTKAATCTEAGAKTYTCTVCSATNPEVIPALGHNYAADFTVDTAATCTAAGSKSKHCSRCDSKTDVTAIEALGHDFSGTYLSDETNHWQKCSRCETESTKTAHTWTGSTCTACGATKTENPDTGEKNVWFEEESNGSLKLCWTDAGLKSSEYYEVTTNPVINQSYRATSFTYISSTSITFPHIIDATQDTTYTITINKRANGALTPLYSTEVEVKVSGSINSISLTGQEDGTYLVNSDFTSKYLIWKAIPPDGASSGFATATSTGRNVIHHSLGEGWTAVIQYRDFEITNDGRSVNITVSPHKVLSVGDGLTLCPTPEGEATVTTASALESALKKGGTVVLDADITISSLNIFTGAPAVLRLNGKTLTVDSMYISNAKELTIDGTTEDSKIVVSAAGDKLVYQGSYTKLVINGGTYGGSGLNLYPSDTASITSGTFSFNPTEYVDTDTHTVTPNDNGTWTVT